MDLTDIRTRIDRIDDVLLERFVERMEIATEVARSKKETGKAVFDPARERDKLAAVAARAPERFRDQAVSLFSLLMSMNKAEQLRVLHGSNPSDAVRTVKRELDAPRAAFPRSARVACQGVEGAYSQIAACRLFRLPTISYCDTFEDVFRAVRDGVCDYGVVPIENSTAGSVNAVYDLLAAYSCSIVKSLRQKIDHQLLAKPGSTLEDIREVYSHEQAVAQCSRFLADLGAHVNVFDNTAMAAEFVATSDRRDVGALSSRDCAKLYGLDILASDVQDTDSNYTRFVVIAPRLEIYPGATRTSLMLTLPHEPGALFRVLERLFALDVNLVKLESRPIVGRDFEFTFYFDVECTAGEQLIDLLDTLDDVCEHLRYFGSYTEVL